MAIVQTINLAHLPPSNPVFVSLFRDVNNAGFLRQQLLEGNSAFEYAFIDASMILSTRHLLAAIFRAVNDMLRGSLRSRNVHSEVVFLLGPNNNIADSFRRFGIGQDTKSVIAVKICNGPATTAASVQIHLTEAVHGISVGFSDKELRGCTDYERLIRTYKLTEISRMSNEHGKEVQQIAIRESHAAKGNRIDKSQDGLNEMESSILGIMALKGW